MQNLPRLLLVDDDRAIVAALCQALQSSYDVDVALSGRLAIYKADNETYDAIMLDLNLPDCRGIDVCQQLRERGCAAPILILTGEGGVMSKIGLLDAGANDYLTKPFSLGELKARLRAMMRPSPSAGTVNNNLSIYGLELNHRTCQAWRNGIELKLRRKEFALLECLMEKAGTVVSRAQLGCHAWQGNDLWTNTVEVHIKHLRDKVDRPFGQRLIHTVHGVGYKLDLITSPQPRKSLKR